MKISDFLAFTFISLILLASCGERGSGEQPVNIETTGLSDKSWALSEQESKWIEQKRLSGGLTAASVNFPGYYEPGANGSSSGFHGELILSMEEFLGLPIDIRLVTFDEIFAVEGLVPEGVIDDIELVYKPDLFNQVDFVAFEITDLPWRLKLMDIIRLSYVRNLFVTRKGEEIRQLGDLQGKTIVTYRHSSQHHQLLCLKEDLKIDFDVDAVPFGTDRFQFVIDGSRDATILESGHSMIFLGDHPELSASLPLGPVFGNGWAVAKDNLMMSSIIRKFRLWARENGQLARAWKNNFRIDIEQYEDLIVVDELGSMDLSDGDKFVLDRLRRNGGLKAAIALADTSYEIDSAGHIDGFQYNLLLAMAQELQIPLEITPVRFTEFFARDGVIPERAMTDPDFHYRPDLLANTDLYVAAITPLPWREKFLSFIPLYPNRMVFVTRAGSAAIPGDEMHKYRFAVMRGTSWHDWMIWNLPVEQMDLLFVGDDRELINAVQSQIADISLYDANLIIPRLKSFTGIDFYPVGNDIEILSWAVGVDDPALYTLLYKTIEYLKSSGSFSRIWQNYYEVSLDEYLRLLREGN